jgi:SagB-type dehydrogenase family enzyme
MPRSHELDAARLYHLNSANLRCKINELTVDHDRHPMRFRTYPGSQRIDLPGRDLQPTASLGDILKRRRSIRNFTLKPLSLGVVGSLLYTSYGVRGYRQVEGQQTFDRPSPSAGGLYPLELYLAAQSVEGLPDGIYHFDARANQLESRARGLFQPQLADMTLGQDMIRDANLVIMISAVFERTMWKYGQRGYRYVWLDAGHLGENLYLVALALGLGPVAIGGFYDDEMNKLLDLPPGEDTIYMLCIGQPHET